ncbi:hypothetical protein F5Y04DRAFT_263430 [Hypomontagnella monticulosa]|nr:hypothetical protein F5Y04DRAFT_263430 [Hypomontagnella monticulosa]
MYRFFREAGITAVECGRNNSIGDGGKIGTLLWVIAGYLENLETDPNAFVADKRSELIGVIHELQWICKCKSWPETKGEVARAQQNIQTFILDPKNYRRREFIAKCEKLCAMLQARESQTHLPSTPSKAIGSEYPEHVKRNLIRGLYFQCFCRICQSSQVQAMRWHPTRIHLKSGKSLEENSILFDVIVATMSLDYWQDIGLNVPLGVRRIRFEGENTPADAYTVECGPDRFCSLASARNRARICFDFKDHRLMEHYDGYPLEQDLCPGFGLTLETVLEQYDLKPKDKVTLAYAIAQAFWQFYDTQLLYGKWTRDCILFMPEDSSYAAQLPNKAYLSVRFDLLDDQPEYLGERSLIHRYPRILSLAILLLEIGLGRPLHLGTHTTILTQVNSDYEAARRGLSELRQMTWKNFANKDTYVQAIEDSLKNTNYRVDEVTYKNNQATNPDSNTLEMARLQARETEEIRKRRKIIYDKVVRPLQWLAETGFGVDSYTHNYLERKLTLESDPTRQFKVASIINTPTFHAGKRIDPHRWLESLKEINTHIKKLQIQYRDKAKGSGCRAVRVAVLDTGYDTSAPIFESSNRSSRVKGWEDFVSSSKDPTDSYGHGTFMTSLLIEAAPVADIYVARVAESTEALQKRHSEVAKAIRWAGMDHQVDIISMSFGFPYRSKEISDAIDQVLQDRKGEVVIFASSGNFGPYQDEVFPACHPSVISIRATNCLGTFLETNPGNDRDESVVLGAIGDDIPEYLRSYRPTICGPGSSAATAIAAGIAAMMLAYTSTLPKVVKIEDSANILRRLHSYEGMQKMFIKMADDMGRRMRFVNPVKFFLDKPTDLDRYAAIYDCMQSIRRTVMTD